MRWLSLIAALLFATQALSQDLGPRFRLNFDIVCGYAEATENELYAEGYRSLISSRTPDIPQIFHLWKVPATGDFISFITIYNSEGKNFACKIHGSDDFKLRLVY